MALFSLGIKMHLLPLFTPGTKVHLLRPHRDLLCYPITLRPTQLYNITSSSTSSALVAQIVCFGLNTDTLLSHITAVLNTYYFECVGAQCVFTLTKYAKKYSPKLFARPKRCVERWTLRTLSASNFKDLTQYNNNLATVNVAT